MRINNQILGNLRENKEDWYYLCNDAEQALFKVKNECKDERAIKSIERMILELNNIRMEQYEALTEYALVESPEIKVGDTITFYSNGYKDNGKFSNKKDILMTSKVTKVNPDGSVSCTDPQGVKSFDYISKDEILTVNGNKLNESSEDDTIEYSATIYQIKDISKCDYAFRDYDEAKDKINMDDYDAVASIVLPKKGSTNDLLEQIFMLGNTDKDRFNIHGKFRSISVSDIIELDNEVYYVDSFGFKKIK